MANIHNFCHKNTHAAESCNPVPDNPPACPEHAVNGVNYTIANQNRNPHNLWPIVPYANPAYFYNYQQYLSQFVPYIYGLVNFNPNIQTSLPEMDIEKVISYELERQQTLMRNPSVRRTPLGQLQLPTRRQVAQKKNQPERRIVNVQLVAMAGSSRDRKPDVEPLPPVEAEFKERVAKINKSQQHYSQLFGRLTTMLQLLNRRYDGHEPEPKDEQEQQLDNEEAPPPPSKRARHLSSSSSESQLEVENDSASQHSQYPQRVQLEDGKFAYVLGPNGTHIDAKEYGEVFWTSAPIATRCLLAAVFTSDELATHTLTGKPSPAFYGRERPAKKMLDQNRVDDIIVSVRNRTGGKERHIRATITTKCADTAKKYKRRAKKANKDNTIVIDE